jgi:hypothetical protein
MNNKLFKHLASDAGFFVYDDDPTSDDLDLISWEMSYDDATLIEYTNLIIKECVNIIQDAVDRGVPANEYADLILNHFSSGQ